MVKIALFLLVLFSWLQYSLWLGKNGLLDFIRVEHDVRVKKNTNAKLKSRNEQMFREIESFNHIQDTLEERSRNELGMIKHGETFYRIVSKQ